VRNTTTRIGILAVDIECVYGTKPRADVVEIIVRFVDYDGEGLVGCRGTFVICGESFELARRDEGHQDDQVKSQERGVLDVDGEEISWYRSALYQDGTLKTYNR
jgi:hypothetical protein